MSYPFNPSKTESMTQKDVSSLTVVACATISTDTGRRLYCCSETHRFRVKAAESYVQNPPGMKPVVRQLQSDTFQTFSSENDRTPS